MSGLTEEDVAQHDHDLRFCNYGLPREIGIPGPGKTYFSAIYPMGPTLRKACLKVFILTFGGVEALEYFMEN